MRTGFLAAITAIVLAGAPPAGADCVSDCSARYEQAMTACRASQPAPSPAPPPQSDAAPGSVPPSADAARDEAQLDAIQPCMDQAQASYGACTDQCQPGSGAMPEMP